MRLKDEVLKAIEEMEPEELGVLYEQIRLLKERGPVVRRVRSP